MSTLNICDEAKQIYPKKPKKDSKERYSTNVTCYLLIIKTGNK